MVRAVRVFMPASIAAAIVVAASCAETDAPTAASVEPPVAALKAAEEEIFGNLYMGGAPIDSGTYFVSLQEVDESGTAVGPTLDMEVNPDRYSSFMYGWYDVDALDGPCNDPPGDEVHTDIPGVGDEVHCVESGRRYLFTLREGATEGPILKQFVIDYPTYWNSWVDIYSMAPFYERLERYPWAHDAQQVGFNDVYLAVDLAGSGTDTPVLWIDKGFDSQFMDMASPSGTNNETFQFSAAASTYTSSITGARMKRPLARIWIYRGSTLVHATGWYTFWAMEGPYGLQRTLRFAELCETAGTYDVALDIMRPDEDEDPFESGPTSNADWRTITITDSGVSLPGHCPPPPALTSVDASPYAMNLAYPADESFPSMGTFTAAPLDQYGQPFTSPVTYRWRVLNTAIARCKLACGGSATQQVLSQGTGVTGIIVKAMLTSDTLVAAYDTAEIRVNLF